MTNYIFFLHEKKIAKKKTHTWDFKSYLMDLEYIENAFAHPKQFKNKKNKQTT